MSTETKGRIFTAVCDSCNDALFVPEEVVRKLLEANPECNKFLFNCACGGWCTILINFASIRLEEQTVGRDQAPLN